MSLIFTGSTSNYYKIDHTVESIAAAEDEWVVSIICKLDSTASADATVFQVLDTDEQGHILIYWDSTSDRLYVQFDGSAVYTSSYKATYGDDWVAITYQRKANGEHGLAVVQVGSNSTSSMTWYANSSTNQPTGGNHYIGVGHNGTSYENPWHGEIADVYFGAGSAILQDITKPVQSDIARATMHPIEVFGEDAAVYFFNFDEAAATETDLINGVDAVKTGTVTSGDPPTRGAGYEAYELYPRPTDVAGYYVDHHSDMDVSTDQYQLGMMLYVDTTKTTGYTVVFEAEYSWSSGEGSIRIYLDHAQDRVYVQFRQDTANQTRYIVNSDFADRWGFLCISREAADEVYIKQCRVADSDTIYTGTTSSVDATYENFNNVGWVIGNGAARRYGQEHNIAEVWLIEDTLTDTELENIANGDNYVTDYAATEDTKFYFQLRGLAIEQSPGSSNVVATEFGSVPSFTHPVAAPPVSGTFHLIPTALTGAIAAEILNQGTLSGTLQVPTGSLVGQNLLIPGSFDGTLPTVIGDIAGWIVTGTFTATLPLLYGDITGSSLTLGGDFLGAELPTAEALFSANIDPTGSWSESFGALTGDITGKSVYPAVLTGTFSVPLANMAGLAQGDGTFAGLMAAIHGKFTGHYTGAVIIESIEVYSIINIAVVVYNIIEAIAAEDNSDPLVEYGVSVLESLVALQNIQSIIHGSASETVVAADAVNISLGALGLTEAFLLSSNTNILSEFTKLVTETTELWENPIPVQQAGIEEIGVIADALDIQGRLRALISEVTSLGYQALVQLVSNVETIETTELGDALDITYVELINEITALATLLSLRQSNVTSLSEVISLGVTLNAVKGFATFMAEVLAVEVSQDLTLAYEQAVAEIMQTEFVISLGGDEYKALVFNTETEAPFFYSNYPFNSFSGDLAATSDGIYRLEGDTDDGTNIDAYFETGYSDFGTSQMKRFQPGGVYIGFANDGSAVVKVSTSNNGKVEEDWYEEDVTFTAFDTERLKVHDGIKSRYWKFKVLNKNGSHLDLDTLQLYPIILNRRLR